MQIRHYAWVIWHSLWLILLGTIICGSATYIISTHIKPVYQASSLIQVHDVSQGNNSNVFTDQALAVSEAILVTSPDVLQEAAKKLPGMSLDQIKKALSVSPESQTEIIEIRAEADTPQQAANIANTVAQAFIQLQAAQKTTQLQSVADQLAQNLATARASLDKAQTQLAKMQTSGASADNIAHQDDIIAGYQANYNSDLANYQSVQLQKLQVTNILTEIQNAVPPDTATRSSALLNTVIALAMGFLLMIVLVLLLDWIDTTIKTSEDVVQMTMMEAAGSIPLSKNPDAIPNVDSCALCVLSHAAFKTF